MKRLPRKLKKKIPEGFYCYEFTGKTSQVWNEEYKIFVPSYGIKLCPFYKSGDGLFGECKLLNCEVIDQVKECSLKLGKFK